MRARLAQPPIEQPRRALGLIAQPQPPECPLRTAQPLRRLQRAQPPATVALVDLLEPHLSYLSQHLCTSHRRPPRRSGCKPGQITRHKDWTKEGTGVVTGKMASTGVYLGGQPLSKKKR